MATTMRCKRALGRVGARLRRKGLRVHCEGARQGERMPEALRGRRERAPDRASARLRRNRARGFKISVHRANTREPQIKRLEVSTSLKKERAPQRGDRDTDSVCSDGRDQ